MIEVINSYVWGKGLIILLLSIGLIYTVRLHFIQLKLFPYFFKQIKNGNNKDQLRTICMSLGTSMGTGNISGVASAISIGGAGAVFWMWVSAFLGMAIVYAENFLSSIYSKKNVRGPMAYIERGLGSKAFALFFSICCVLACLGTGGMVQISTLSDSLRNCIDINPIYLAIVLFSFIFIVIKGGVKRIGSTAQVLLPCATILYMLISLGVIILHKDRLPTVFSLIFSEAFGINQIAGGISGHALSQAMSAGIRRGVFSNEAGLGSSPILHSSSKSADCGTLQGMSSMLEVFIDTFLCCTLTAVVILTSAGDYTVRNAFVCILGTKTDCFLAAIMSVFALCTVIGWYYCGETAFKYISKSDKSLSFSFIFSLVSSMGVLFGASSVWLISDVFNGLMAFPNLIALLFLIKKVKRE